MNIKKIYSERKRKKRLPVKAVCRNCESVLYGRYCHFCGQDLFQGSKRTLGSIIYHSAENLFAIDNKLFVSLKYLLFQPGKLTKEYINGRIVRYIHPTKLFWFISILFFMLLAIVPSNEDNLSQSEKLKVETEVTDSTGSSLADVPDKTLNTTDNITTKNAKEKNKTKNDNDLQQYQIKQSFMKYAPYVSFLLIPFFAFLLTIFFRKKEFFYADHLIFALHFHAFVFILFSIYILIDELFPRDHDYDIYFFLVPSIYFLWSLWTVYHPKISTLLFKTFAIMLTYGIAIICSIILLFVASLLLSGNKDVIDKIIINANS